MACELEGHALADCFYTFPERAFKGFKLRKSIQDHTNRNLKREDISAEVQRVKGKKPRQEGAGEPL